MAVAIETASRALIHSASREAMQNGVYRGMPLDQATKNCRDLIVLPPNEELYFRATHALLQILGQYTPIFEPLRFGHAYLDMTGSAKLFGSAKDAAAKVQREIRDRLHLDASAGVACNKLVSKAASDFVTNLRSSEKLYDVRRGDEENFLAPLQVGYLPGVEKMIRQQLLDLNVRFIRELAALAAENLQMVFGTFGLLLHQRAHGIDERPVQPPKRAFEVVQVATLEPDSNDFEVIRSKIFLLLSHATRQLREKGLLAQRLVLEIRYSDHKEGRTQHRLIPTDDDQALVAVATAVLERVLTRRIRVRKITLRLRDLSTAPQQLSFFDDIRNTKSKAITQAMDKIRNRFGENAIRFGWAA